MNSKTSKLTTLLSSASFLTLASSTGALAQQMAQAQVAQTQAVPAEVPEQVLITGSLIHGAAAVGVPVTNLGTQDFAQTGSLTTADLFRTVPSALVSPGPVGTNANNNIGKQTRVNIRNLDPNDGTRSLMLVDGYRFPPQGEADCTIDPSVIPAIALDRIDILVDGSSATYGSDAIAGVVNIILKRGYDGAISQFRVTAGKGHQTYQASQLWGRTWDGGDITLSYEWSDASPTHGKDAPRWQMDFTPWGLEDRTPIRSSLPGTVSVGNPTQPASLGLGTGGANALGHNCTNCFAIPVGFGSDFNPAVNAGLGPLAPGSGTHLDWPSFAVAGNGGATNPAAGTRNVFNPYTLLVRRCTAEELRCDDCRPAPDEGCFLLRRRLLQQPPWAIPQSLQSQPVLRQRSQRPSSDYQPVLSDRCRHADEPQGQLQFRLGTSFLHQF